MLCDLNFFLNRELTRKEFLEALAQQSLLAIGFATAFSPATAAAWINIDKEKKSADFIEASYYQKLNGGEIQCFLCPHECIVPQGERGECGVRENRNGKYYTLTYNHPCALHVDPVEKKPLFHVFPGAKVFSLATAGCNLKCLFCQNWQISQALPEEVESVKVNTNEIIQKARDKNCRLIAYTYSEPTIFFEYMLDIAQKAHDEGLINTCHSNGYINNKPLSVLLKSMDAANIDLKGFTDEYYKEVCGGELKPVLRSLKQIKESGTHLEITNLIVPSKNDQPQKLRQMCKWINSELGPDIPIHFSRFYPKYKLKNLPHTPENTMHMAREIAMEEGLNFVYLGNLHPGHEAENTYCSNCHKVIIERRGYIVKKIEIKDGRCRFCEHRVPGIWG